MKKTIAFTLAILSLALILTGCMAPKLNGTYSSTLLLAETIYEFRNDNTVTYKLFIAGFSTLTKEGTYEINEDETKITLTFNETEQDKGLLPDGVDLISGTFDFDEGEGYIIIGKTKYEKQGE